MAPLYALVGFLVVQRLVELAISRRHCRQLLAEGGVEFGRGHYPLVVALHVGWLAALLFLVGSSTPVSAPLAFLFGALQIARIWTIATLGRFFTTRIIVLPGVRRVRTGPYRHLEHPLYLIVALELAVVPLMFGAWPIALAATLLNGLLLRHRIGVEDRALVHAYGK